MAHFVRHFSVRLVISFTIIVTAVIYAAQQQKYGGVADIPRLIMDDYRDMFDNLLQITYDFGIVEQSSELLLVWLVLNKKPL